MVEVSVLEYVMLNAFALGAVIAIAVRGARLLFEASERIEGVNEPGQSE